MAAMGAVGTLFAIVNLTSTATAAPDWHLYKKAKSGKTDDRVEVTSHLALDVLNAPNKFYSRNRLFEAGQQHVDLTGESRILVTTDKRMKGVPTGLWVIRPDRITPVPSATDFLAGYTYKTPDGADIPLDPDQIMSILMPNPLDPYRGMGPVQAILKDAESIEASIEWNAAFFQNGAEPGGIIESTVRLSDPDFATFQKRWGEQHRGVSNAHRVALIEQGKWVDRKYSHTDMGFAQLRTMSRDAIREAFIVHGHMLGDADDVNLANATAAELTFARRLAVPRLNRWRAMLNTEFLPKFGGPADGYEFDYDSPVAEDEKSSSEIFLSRARGAMMLVQAGFDGKGAASAAGLPEMDWSADAVIHSATSIAAPNAVETANHAPARIVSMRPALAAAVEPGDVDLTQVQEAWVHALNALLSQWSTDVTPAQRDALVAQIAEIIDAHGIEGLNLDDLDVDTAAGAALAKVAMVGLADIAGRHVVQEAARQGHDILAATADADGLQAWASMSSELIAMGLKIAAGRQALRVATPEMSGRQVADEVQKFLTDLSDASIRGQLGAALTAAQNAGRLSTMRQGPEASLYADERMDANTCDPCKEVNGRFLGLVSDMDQVDRMYGAAGYIDCIGAMYGNSCRGTVVALWRPKQGSGSGDGE